MMRNLLIRIYSLLFRLFIYSLHANLRNTKFWLCKFRIARHNTLSFIGSYCSKTIIKIEGGYNKLNVEGEVFNCNISIVGDNNEFLIQKGCKVYNATIILRGDHCKFLIGESSTVGKGYFVSMGESNSIQIGEECMLGDEVEVWSTDSHPIYDELGTLLNPGKSIFIGNHVWIGKRAIILKGVRVGDNAVVGMNSLVTKDIPPSSLSVGNPNRIIKDKIRWERKYISDL